MPTGMSVANNRLLVTTLEHAYLFDLDALETPPVSLTLPFAGQREAIALRKTRMTRHTSPTNVATVFVLQTYTAWHLPQSETVSHHRMKRGRGLLQSRGNF